MHVMLLTLFSKLYTDLCSSQRPDPCAFADSDFGVDVQMESASLQNILDTGSCSQFDPDVPPLYATSQQVQTLHLDPAPACLSLVSCIAVSKTALDCVL